jgi:hypothetical protein
MDSAIFAVLMDQLLPITLSFISTLTRALMLKSSSKTQDALRAARLPSELLPIVLPLDTLLSALNLDMMALTS